MSAPEFETSPGRFDPLAYLQLVRIPNVFTSVADVLLGYLVTHQSLEPWAVFGSLLASSTLLYLAGMVLNDFYDRDIDARDRPGRPIPSGRVSPGMARRLGFGMLGLGAALGAVAGYLAGDPRPARVALLLAVAVVLYDRVLKRTPLAPLAMGGCRFLNVLLGMSASEAPWAEINYLVAGGVGVYIVGVTWFARTEARESKRGQLILATLVMMAGIALLAWFPEWKTGDELPEIRPPSNWLLFWGMIGVLILWRCLLAIADPQPQLVQMAVKNSILSLIILDAGACIAVHPPFVDFWAVLIAVLIVPAMMLGRWVYST